MIIEEEYTITDESTPTPQKSFEKITLNSGSLDDHQSGGHKLRSIKEEASF